jgi:hypothetical protein
MMLNDPQVRFSAEALATKLAPTCCRSPEAAVETAFLASIGRRPSQREQSTALQFLQSQAESYAEGHGSQSALADFCQMLFGLNEFVYVR